MSYPDLAMPIRNALLNAAEVSGAISTYKGSKAIFTRRPAPQDAEYPMIMVSPDISKTDEDGLDDERPIITRDVTVYGQNDTAANYRAVETIARSIHDLFHRQWRAIEVPGWKIVSIVVTGPIPAPTDDDETIARLVPVSIKLARTS